MERCVGGGQFAPGSSHGIKGMGEQYVRPYSSIDQSLHKDHPANSWVQN